MMILVKETMTTMYELFVEFLREDMNLENTNVEWVIRRGEKEAMEFERYVSYVEKSLDLARIPGYKRYRLREMMPRYKLWCKAMFL